MKTRVILAGCVVFLLLAGAASAQVIREDLVGEIWRQDIEGGDLRVIYVRFRADGTFAYNRHEPRNFRYDHGQETWTIERGVLRLSWDNGGCIDTFPLLDGTRTRLNGVQSVGNLPIRFSRVSTGSAEGDAQSFTDTVWTETVEGGSPPTLQIRFRDDGYVEYLFPQNDEFQLDRTDTWRIESGQLVVIWSNGFSVDRYDLAGGSGDVLTGTKTQTSNNRNYRIRLERNRDD